MNFYLYAWTAASILIIKKQAIFLNFMGQAISAVEIRKLFKMICEKAELNKPGLTVHKLRHSCLTMLFNAGIDLVNLKYIAGHETIRTTAQYLHVTQQHLRAAYSSISSSETFISNPKSSGFLLNKSKVSANLSSSIMLSSKLRMMIVNGIELVITGRIQKKSTYPLSI